MVLMYIGLLASFVTYIYFRIRYTLKIAKDQKDRSADAQYTLSVYSIFTLCIEVLCMAAMALFSGAERNMLSCVPLLACRLLQRDSNCFTQAMNPVFMELPHFALSCIPYIAISLL